MHESHGTGNNHEWSYALDERTKGTAVVVDFVHEKEEVIILREDVSIQQAKEEIRQLFDSSDEQMDYGDIADKLCLDLKFVVKACSELIEEGVIEFA